MANDKNKDQGRGDQGKGGPSSGNKEEARKALRDLIRDNRIEQIRQERERGRPN